MGNKDKNVENRLLDGCQIDQLISRKIEEKIQRERILAQQRKNTKKVVVTDFQDVPQDMIFSHKAIYLVFNRKNQTESFINGVQAEGIIGMNADIRQNMLNKLICFQSH